MMRAYRERGALARAFATVWRVRILLWTSPAEGARLVAAETAIPAQGASGSVEEILRIVWAVDRASRLVLGANCLTRALAAKRLLGPHASAVQLRIGASKGAGERLKAHAWLELNGRIILGGAESARHFVPLTRPVHPIGMPDASHPPTRVEHHG